MKINLLSNKIGFLGHIILTNQTPSMLGRFSLISSEEGLER